MSGKQAFFYGALGGALPILANLLTVDLAPIIDHRETLTLGNYIGYTIRLLALVAAGGVVALVNSDVKQPLALVQLGITAPALVTAYINGSSPAVKHALLDIVSTANAEEVLPRSQMHVAGVFSDVMNGFSTRLDAVSGLNKGSGSFCVTGQGKAALAGPASKIGSHCSVQTPVGTSSGLVTN